MAEIPGIIRIISKAFGGVFGIIFKRFRLSLTLFFLVLMILQATNTSINEGSPYPLIKEIAFSFFAADNIIYEEATRIEKQGGLILPEKELCDENSIFIKICKISREFTFFVEIIKTFFKVIYSLWFIYILIHLFSKIWGYTPLSDPYSHFRNVSLAILTIWGVSVIFLFANAALSYFIFQEKTTPQEIIGYLLPARGIVKLVKVSPLILTSASGASERITDFIPHILNFNNTLSSIPNVTIIPNVTFK